MTQALRVFTLTMGRLNLWIAALLLAGLLHHPQGALQAEPRAADQRPTGRRADRGSEIRAGQTGDDRSPRPADPAA